MWYIEKKNRNIIRDILNESLDVHTFKERQQPLSKYILEKYIELLELNLSLRHFLTSKNLTHQLEITRMALYK